MPKLKASAEYHVTWEEFCNTAKSLGDAVTYKMASGRADCYAQQYPCESEFDFSRPTPLFIHVEDANEFIARLWGEVSAKYKNVQALTVKANMNSNNSSSSPSQDSIADKAKRNLNSKHKPSGKKQGAQPGHQAHWRKRRPLAEVDEIVTCAAPACCPKCDKTLAKASICQRKQVSYLIEKRNTLKEFQVYKAYCSDCKKYYKGQLPKGTPRGAFGSCVLAAMALLSGRYRISKGDVKGCANDLLGVSISVGSISNIEYTVSQAIEAPKEEVHEVLKEAAVTNNDETTFYRKHKTTWLWATANAKFAYFKLQDRRNRAAAKILLGETVKNIRIMDRCPSYHYMPKQYRQYCWSHLGRDIQAIVEHTDASHAVVGQRLDDARYALFTHYRQYSTATEAEQLEHKKGILNQMKDFRYALREGLTLTETKTARFCRNLIRDWKCLWHFLRRPDVDPTNNHGERILRHCVLWRKASLGTQSIRGDRYVEGISTASQTCRLQGKHLYTFLMDAVQAWWEGAAAPSLIL